MLCLAEEKTNMLNRGYFWEENLVLSCLADIEKNILNKEYLGKNILCSGVCSR